MWHARLNRTLALVLSLLAGLGALAPLTAVAQNAKEQAKQHYARGQEYFEAGRFTEAEAAFQRAYDASPHPVVLLSIAESRLGQGNFTGAVAAFQKYLRDKPGAADKADVEERIQKIKAKPGKLAIRSSPVGAQVAVDGEPVAGVTPTSIELEPGMHEVAVSLDGHHRVNKRIDVGYGSNEVLKFELNPIQEDTIGDLESTIQAGSEVETAEDSSDLPVGALIAGGVGAAGLISGIVFGVLALDAESEFDANPTADTADKGETYALLADVSYGVAIAGAATAIILWVTHDSGSKESIEVEKDAEVEKEDEWAKISVQPVFSPNYAGINTALQF